MNVRSGVATVMPRLFGEEGKVEVSRTRWRRALVTTFTTLAPGAVHPHWTRIGPVDAAIPGC